MTAGGIEDRTERCPVCANRTQSCPLLELTGQPIYQHPIAADAVVPAPHSIDLVWAACAECAHAWQPEFDAGLLERIYRSHYYTPAPDGIAVQFRNDFLSTIGEFGLLAPRRVLLEIGASNGDVLAEVCSRTGAQVAYAFEPDRENASVARRRGLDVREQFFGGSTATSGLQAAELIFARHVIEHVFDFGEFFAGLNATAAPDADLILETPSLDHHAVNKTFDPFHVEHVHVFSLRSLATLARESGWELWMNRVSAAGNLIAAFKRARSPAVRGARIDAPAPPLGGVQESYRRHRNGIRQQLKDRPLIFWGAGSAGVGLARLIEREPEYWTDGNPGKVGKKFVGFARPIVSPEEALAGAESLKGGKPLLVIASSFASEILPRVQALGWCGEVLDLAGNRIECDSRTG